MLSGGNRHDVTELIPLNDRQTRHGHGFGLGKLRWVVEWSFAWLHAVKRLCTRYERRADIHEVLLSLAWSVICLKTLHNSN